MTRASLILWRCCGAEATPRSVSLLVTSSQRQHSRELQEYGYSEMERGILHSQEDGERRPHCQI